MNNSLRSRIDKKILVLLEIEETIYSLNNPKLTNKEIYSIMQDQKGRINTIIVDIYEFAKEEMRTYKKVGNGWGTKYKYAANKLNEASKKIDISCFKDWESGIKTGERSFYSFSFYETIKRLYDAKWIY